MSRTFLKDEDQRSKIASRIQEVVNETYASGADFCRKFKISESTYSRMKNDGDFTIEFLIRFAAEHHKSLDWLLRKVGQKDLTPKESKEPTD
jgi:hypothetical protein